MCLWVIKEPFICCSNEHDSRVPDSLLLLFFVVVVVVRLSQNPREADAMTKVQAELDETKIILVS